MPKIYKSKQAAQFLGLSAATLTSVKKKGEIAFVQLSTGRVGYLEEDLQTYLNAKRINAKNTAQ